MFRFWMACFVVLAVCSGCALLPLATLSTVLGIADTAVSTGGEVYSAGKLDIAFMVDDRTCRLAAQTAAADLQLRIVRSEPLSGDKWDFQFRDEFKSKIEVTVQKRSERLCRCRVDVGFFGSRPTAELIMRRIEAHLPGPATMPAGASN